jgi:hypothetical protein
MDHDLNDAVSPAFFTCEVRMEPQIRTKQLFRVMAPSLFGPAISVFRLCSCR